MERHDLVWPSEVGWQQALLSINPRFHNVLAKWSKENWPVVIRRKDTDTLPNEICVGISLSSANTGFKEKIGFKISRDHISKSEPSLPLEQVIPSAPHAWQEKLILLNQDFKHKGLAIFVYGSLAWQALTSEGYLTPESDIDLLVYPKTRLDFDHAMTLLKKHNEKLPLDGEIHFPSGHAVAWKECAKVIQAGGAVLAKKEAIVQILPLNQLMETLLDTSKIGRLALRSMFDELLLYPKPGLVSLVDSGSHSDMDARTFMKSIFALRHYFKNMVHAGLQMFSFEELKRMGIEAEVKMMQATLGINTHRGAIFSLGLLSAAVGSTFNKNQDMTPDNIRKNLLTNWGKDLENHSKNGLSFGARKEAALGFPSVFELGLPLLNRLLKQGLSMECARIEVLFALMATISDTNVSHRGGKEGVEIVQNAAKEFIIEGGTQNPKWQEKGLIIHHLFIKHRLSPGGAADLLAATCFVHSITGNKS